MKETLLQAGTSDADGDRKTATTYALLSDASIYRLVRTGEERFHRDVGAFVLYGKTARGWDPTLRVPETDSVWFDGSSGTCTTATPTCAITRRAYDMQTGNLEKTWKPVQWASVADPETNAPRSSLTYDSRKLFVARQTNELGHVVDHLYEYGTGTRLQTLGPNTAFCAPSCPAGTELRETHRVRIDGIGRTIEEFETEGDASYTLRKVGISSYIDGQWPSATPSITEQSAIDVDASTQVIRYTQQRTDLDGHGRPLRTTVCVAGPGPAGQCAAGTANHVTTNVYRNDGTLAEVRVPDPTQNNTATVTYTYTFDSLGRAKSVRRPDSLSTAGQSGVDITYSGLDQTTTEVVGVDGGTPAEVTTRKDAFGRIRYVDEKHSLSPIAWATTEYQYGPDDAVSTIIDAEGVPTSLVHDFAGRRTRVERGTRVWTYAYDKNGNLATEKTPCTGSACGIDGLSFTTSTVYDALDRPMSKAIAPRTLSSADLALFGSTVELFKWDSETNGIGLLSTWESRHGSNPPTTTLHSEYDVQGHRLRLAAGTSAAGYSNLNRSFIRSFNLAGMPRVTQYEDIMGDGAWCVAGTLSIHEYDNRGLPYQVKVWPCYAGTSSYSFVRNTRNIAGLVTERSSVPGIGAFSNAKSAWTYDSLGRVRDHVVSNSPGGHPLVQAARQELKYFGNDDPEWMNHWLGTSNQKHFTFGYDARHQLETVSETNGAFSATYQYDEAGRFFRANEAAAALPNGDVKPRDVEYQYSTADPERLLRLRKVGTNKNLAEYAYDDAGNQLSCYYPDTKERWDYVYDGKNQLRRVTKKINNSVQGSEEYWYDGNNARYLVVKRDSNGAKIGAIWFIDETEAHYDAKGCPVIGSLDYAETLWLVACTRGVCRVGGGRARRASP